MKRKYVTPLIAVEHYELTQAIAACDIKIGLLDSACVKNDADSTEEMIYMAIGGYFIDGCSKSADGMSGQDGLCFHTNANAAFSS